jgi:hypothetical protein
MIVRASLAICASLWAAACSPEPQQPTAPLHPTLRVESSYPPIVNMEIDFGSAARTGRIIDAAGEAALRFGQDMVTGKSPAVGQIESINFTVLGSPGSDPSVGRKVLHFTIDAQELRQLAHFGSNGAAVIDSARDVGTWQPANGDIVADYCAKRSSAVICKDRKR